MTIPATVDHFLVQNVFQLETGLPEDVVVNNFLFRNQDNSGGLTASAEERCRNAVRDFFVGTAPAVPTAPNPLATSILQSMPLAINGWSMKVYDLGDPPGGRAPVSFDLTADLPAGRSANPLPSELAVVLTLQTPIIGRRGKGRVYLGPFGTAAMVTGVGGAYVNSGLVDRILAQASRLALGNGQDVEWHVWSTTRQRTARVVGGRVDNAWDVQRRRGIKPLFRRTFGTVTPTTPATP